MQRGVMRKNTRVLVCEDDSAIRTLVELLLRRSGYSVDVTTDGSAAIDALARHIYDAVVLDLLMPCTSGYEVLEFLRKNRPQLLSRVIVTTAFPKAFGEDFPIAALVHKPFDIEELESLVRRTASDTPSHASQPKLSAFS